MSFADDLFNILNGLPIDQENAHSETEVPDPVGDHAEHCRLENLLGHTSSPASVAKSAESSWDEPLGKASPSASASDFAKHSDARFTAVCKKIKTLFGAGHEAEAEQAIEAAARMRAEARGAVILEL